MTKTAFLLLSSLIYLISLLPLRVHYFFSSILIFFISKIMGYRRYTSTINIARSFPEFKYDRVEKTVNKFFKNFSEIIAESIWIVSASRKSVSKMVAISNPDVLSEIYKRGDSVILVGGHTGNWEIITRMELFSSPVPIGFEGDSLIVAYKRQHSKLSDKLVRWTRSGQKTANLVESGSLARYMLKNKNKKHCYVLYADQTPLPGSKFVVNFLHRETTMINGPEVLSRLIDCPVVYFEMMRERRGRYKIVLTKITDKPSDVPEGYITEKYARLLEETIISSPDNWLWSHKRWKRGVEEN
jgi:KDO2-lipid IV(A) lauroyltransferase